MTWWHRLLWWLLGPITAEIATQHAKVTADHVVTLQASVDESLQNAVRTMSMDMRQAEEARKDARRIEERVRRQLARVVEGVAEDPTPPHSQDGTNGGAGPVRMPWEGTPDDGGGPAAPPRPWEPR